MVRLSFERRSIKLFACCCIIFSFQVVLSNQVIWPGSSKEVKLDIFGSNSLLHSGNDQILHSPGKSDFRMPSGVGVDQRIIIAGLLWSCFYFYFTLQFQTKPLFYRNSGDLCLEETSHPILCLVFLLLCLVSETLLIQSKWNQGCHWEVGARDFPRLTWTWPLATFKG